MNAKKLMVGLVTAVTLTLFTVAVYAQQLAAPQEDTAQASVAHQEERVRPNARATRAGVGARSGIAQSWRPGHRSVGAARPSSHVLAGAFALPVSQRVGGREIRELVWEVVV